MVETIDPELFHAYARDKKHHPNAPRRSWGSARASGFFTNATRSPRDLTTLAARVHSPAFDEKPSISGLLEDSRSHEDDKGKALSEVEQVRAQWQLPSFSFRPVSFGSNIPELKERPKTSGDARSTHALEILSPMPERPMSSQSRTRFSRILEMSDNYFTDQRETPYHPHTSSRLDVVAEHPDLQALERSLSPPPHLLATTDAAGQESHSQKRVAEQASPSANGDASQVTPQERSTIDSLLDRHIECLGLNETEDESETSSFQGGVASVSSAVEPESSEESTIKASSVMAAIQQAPSPCNFRPTTSSSTIQHTSLASSERRRLIPRRLFASLDARLPPGAILSLHDGSTFDLTSGSPGFQPRSSGWQTLPSTSGLITSESTKSLNKASLTSGDLADIDSDPPQTRFKIRRVSELSLSPETDSSICSSTTSRVHRRSKSDILARQVSHQRRRARILVKAKRKSQSLGQLANIDRDQQEWEDAGQSEDWTTEDSPEKVKVTSPVAGHAELSADSVAVQPPTLTSEASIPAQASIPRRWTSMLTAMPQPVKKSIENVRKASVRTVHSHGSNTSVTEPMNSTRYSPQIPRIGSVPQLAPPEFGPPLTSSDLNLSLRYPGSPKVYRPPLRQAQSSFPDDSSSALAQKKPATPKKRFDLHSFRSGFTKSTSLMGTRHNSTQRGASTLKASPLSQMKNRRSFETPHEMLGDTVPMSDFAYRKRKVLGRLKEWWKKQCMQKTLALVRKKSGRNMRNQAWA